MVADPHAQALFRKLGVDVDSENAGRVFRMLDLNSSQVLSFDEFKAGIYRMHGGAKSIDIATLLVRTDHLTRQLNKLTGRVSIKKLQQPRRERYQRMTTTITN